MFPPQRIVCLTEETVETLYLLGEQDRIVGISGYVVRPPQARREKPRVSAFTSANIDKILVLTPDLVLTFSDLQADIAADLIRRGLNLHAFNQRSVAGILDMIRTVGAMVDASDRAEQLVGALEARLAEARNRAECLPKRPRVFFEEWDVPAFGRKWDLARGSGHLSAVGTSFFWATHPVFVSLDFTHVSAAIRVTVPRVVLKVIVRAGCVEPYHGIDRAMLLRFLLARKGLHSLTECRADDQ
jgi:hypothetical protein